MTVCRFTEAQTAFQEGEQAPMELEESDFKPTQSEAGSRSWLLGCTALKYGSTGPLVFSDPKEVFSTLQMAVSTRACSGSPCEI